MNNIILYTIGCPQCKVLEHKLKQKNLLFKTVTDEDLMIKKGFLSSPMLEVDNKIMNYH